MRLAALLLLWVSFVPFAVVRGAEGYDGTEYPYSTLVTQTGDYFVVIEQPSTFTAETDLCDNTTAFWCAAPQQGGNFTDSALWLYAADGGLLTSNDDDPRTNGQSYQSFITVSLEAGVYRLRAGRFTCRDGSCMWPQDPFPVGGHYQLLTTAALLLDPTPPTVVPTAIPSVLPTPEPTPTQTPEEPSPSPSVAPTPTPEPSVEPEPTPQPTPQPTPTPTPTEEPSPEVTNAPTPTPTPEPTPAPTEVPPSPSVFPDPTSVPTPQPEPALPVVGAAVEAVGEVFANIAAITEIGKDLDPIEKEEAQPVAVAIIASQVASVAAAASNAARAAANIGGGGPAGGNGNTPSRKGGRRA